MRNILNIEELIMTKTSAEIKLEIVKLTNQILTNHILEKRNTLFQEYNMKSQNDPKAIMPSLPDLPTIENIIVESEKLNKYINQD